MTKVRIIWSPYKNNEEFYSNAENGLGFADTVIDNTVESKAVIIEYKKAEKEKVLRRSAQEP